MGGDGPGYLRIPTRSSLGQLTLNPFIMKQLKLFLVVVAVALLQPALGQSMPRQAVAAGGGSFESASLHVSWTIGQAEPVATITQPSMIFCGGFQQYDAVPVAIREPQLLNSLSAFPNPCNEHVLLNTNFDQAAMVSFDLINTRAESILSEEWESPPGVFSKKIGTANLAPGPYFLRLTVRQADRTEVHSLMIIKQ